MTSEAKIGRHSERERNLKEINRVREFSGANFSKHYNRRRAEAPPTVQIPPPNPLRIWNDFKSKPTLLKMDPRSFELREVIKVRIQDPTDLPYPISFLRFWAADKDLELEYITESRVMNEVYSSILQITTDIILRDEDRIEGNVAVILEQDVFKRAVILETPDPKLKRVFCYLVDEGTEVMVHQNRVYRAVQDFWKLPARTFKFRLTCLQRYEFRTEYRRLLIREFGPESDNNWELSARIVSKKPDGDSIFLNSSKYPKLSINKIFVRQLSDDTRTPNIFSAIQLGQSESDRTQPFSSFAPVTMDGANWGVQNRPFTPLAVGETVDIVIVGENAPGQFFVRPAYASSIMDIIQSECQKYLGEFDRDSDKVCTCMKDGFHFVVEREDDNRCTRYCRIRVSDRTLKPIQNVEDALIESTPKKVECLFLDRGEYKMVPVADLRVMNPAMAIYPAQGALAVWSCNEYKWKDVDWNRLVKSAINQRFKGKVLTLVQDQFGRSKFEMNLYTVGSNDTVGILLKPKDNFWKTRKVTPMIHPPSREADKNDSFHYENKISYSLFDGDNDDDVNKHLLNH